MKVQYDTYFRWIDVAFSNTEMIMTPRTIKGKGAGLRHQGFWVTPLKAKELIEKLQRELKKTEGKP